MIGAFFVLPLLMSAVLAFRAKDGGFTFAHFEKAWELYRTDLLFTILMTGLSTVLIGIVAIAIAGYLTLGENPRAVAILRWLYRWPLFIPFIVTGQVMRAFLAKNGMLNHVLIGSGIIEPLAAQSLLDWRGIVIAFVWKQAPFVTLLLAGAMAGFLPVELCIPDAPVPEERPPAPRTGLVEIVMPSGVRVTIAPEIERAALKKVLGVICELGR